MLQTDNIVADRAYPSPKYVATFLHQDRARCPRDSENPTKGKKKGRAKALDMQWRAHVISGGMSGNVGTIKNAVKIYRNVLR